MARVERRRKWTAEEKVALLAEVEAAGGRVAVVARHHQVSESLLYNWRSAWRAAARLLRTEPAEFVPIGVIGRENDDRPPLLAAPADTRSPERPRSPGMIEVELQSGA